MRYFCLIATGLALSVLAAVSSPTPRAYASFHCMRIHGVLASFNGDGRLQYVELRQNTGGQNFVAGHTLQFFDASNQLQATFTFPALVPNGLTGDSILIATSEFNGAAVGGIASDH